MTTIIGAAPSRAASSAIDRHVLLAGEVLAILGETSG